MKKYIKLSVAIVILLLSFNSAHARIRSVHPDSISNAQTRIDSIRHGDTLKLTSGNYKLNLNISDKMELYAEIVSQRGRCWTETHNIILAFIVGAGLLFLIFGVGIKYFTKYANKRVNDWLGHDKRYNYGKDDFVVEDLKFSSKLKNLEPEEKTRLEEQYKEIQIRWKIHLNVVMYYYERYYMAITMATILAILTAVPLLFLSILGWNQVHVIFRTVFLISIGSMVFFVAFPKIYKSRRNIEENKALFISYAALKHWVQTYAITGKDSKGKTKSLEKFIHDIDVQLAEFHKFPIEFDPSSIPVPRKVLKEMTVEGK